MACKVGESGEFSPLLTCPHSLRWVLAGRATPGTITQTYGPRGKQAVWLVSFLLTKVILFNSTNGVLVGAALDWAQDSAIACPITDSTLCSPSTDFTRCQRAIKWLPFEFENNVLTLKNDENILIHFFFFFCKRGIKHKTKQKLSCPTN